MKSGPYEDRADHLGFVAHEFRNPLSTALWCAELLGRLSPEERGGARGAKLAAMTQRALTRVSRLLEDHFAAERLLAGGLGVRRESLGLLEVLEAAAGKADLAVRPVLLVPAGLRVEADGPLLSRLLEALLAAAGRGGAAVTADVGLVEGGVRVVVRGAEVPAEALGLPRKGTPSDPTGRALGLLVARAAAEAHGGSVRSEEGALVLDLPGGAAPAETAGESHP